MEDFGVAATMAEPKKIKKASGKKPIGRPKADTPLRSIVSLKGSDELEGWLDGLVDHAHQGTRSLLLKNALREYGENHGYPKPLPKR